MGGTAAVATAAVAAKNLIDQHHANKEATKKLTDLKLQDKLNRKKALNLLDEDMAARRAKLSRNGVLNSNSSLAYMTRGRKQAYDDMSENALKYASSIKDVQNDYKKKTDDIWASAANSLSNTLLK